MIFKSMVLIYVVLLEFRGELLYWNKRSYGKRCLTAMACWMTVVAKFVSVECCHSTLSTNLASRLVVIHAYRITPVINPGLYWIE